MLLLIAPAATLMVLFQVVPIVIGANASFRDWALNDPKKTWVGLKHYVGCSPTAHSLQVVLPNTFVFMALSVARARGRTRPGPAAQPSVPRPSWCRPCCCCL
jgi:multiple sugar transport system permease protein